jgi:hypothetical protein
MREKKNKEGGADIATGDENSKNCEWKVKRGNK